MRKRRFRLIISILTIIILLFSGCGKNVSQILESGVRNDKLNNKIIILDERTPMADEAISDITIQCYNLINSYRQMNGLPDLKWSPVLEKCAITRAEEAEIYWSHDRPNGKPWYTLNPKIMHGENLAMGYNSAEDIVNAWIDSPTHNELLLAYDFNYIAIAQYNGYYACEFG